jgi:signal transduction histidine kinase
MPHRHKLGWHNEEMNLPIRKPKLKLKLIHSGLILVSVPLIFGWIMTVALNSALQQSLQMRKSIERRAIASDAINKLVRDCIEFRTDIIDRNVDELYTTAKSSDVRTETQRVNEDMSTVRDDAKILNELTEKHEQYRNQLAEVLLAAKTTLNVAESCQNNDVEKASKTNLDFAIQNLENVAEKHSKLLPIDSEAAKLHDRDVQQVLAWLLAANFMACPLLVLYFSQKIVRRLGVLVTNAERLAQDKRLLDPIDGDDEIAHLDAVFRSMAKKIADTRTEREEIERLKKEFVSMIGHDLRTPLSAVQGTLTLIADGVYGDISDSGVSKAKIAEESIERLTNLANELLDIEKFESKKLPIELKPTQLQSAIQRSIESLEGFALYKQISIQSIDTNLEVMADEARLIQVIVNLISNAIKFSPDGSTVSVFALPLADGQVEVRVTDQGRGIAPDKHKEIFDRFKQISKSDADNERGMGLGLAICKAIVESHGGEIGVVSSLNTGCSFWFRLQQVEQRTIKTTNKHAPQAAPARGEVR